MNPLASLEKQAQGELACRQNGELLISHGGDPDFPARAGAAWDKSGRCSCVGQYGVLYSTWASKHPRATAQVLGTDESLGTSTGTCPPHAQISELPMLRVQLRRRNSVYAQGSMVERYKVGRISHHIRSEAREG